MKTVDRLRESLIFLAMMFVQKIGVAVLLLVCTQWVTVSCGRIGYEVIPADDTSTASDTSDSGAETGTGPDTDTQMTMETDSDSDTQSLTGLDTDVTDTGETSTGTDTGTGTGTDTEQPPLPPSAISLTMRRDSADILWTSGGGGTIGFLVVRSILPITWEPQPGLQYSVEDVVSGGEVVYFGPGTSTFDDDQGAQLTEGTLYYFGIYAYNGNFIYSIPITDGALTMVAGGSRFRFNVRSVNGQSKDPADDPARNYLVAQDLRFQMDGEWVDSAVTGTNSGAIGPYAISSVSASDYFNDFYYPWYLLDGGPNVWSTNYDTFAASAPYDGTPDQWVQVDFGAQIVNITGYQVIGGSDYPVPDRFDLSYWDSSGSAFVVIPGSIGAIPSHSSPYYTWADPGGDGSSAPNPPANVEVRPGDSRIGITYTDGNGDTEGYMIVRGTGEPFAFTPVDGITYAPGAIGAEEILYVGTGLSISDTFAINGNSYTYALYAFDVRRNYSRPRHVKAAAYQGHRFYRFVVDSTATSVESTLVFEVQFKASSNFLTNAVTGNRTGTIGGYPVVVDYSSYGTAQQLGWKTFDGLNSGPQNNGWLSMKYTFSNVAPYDADPPQWVSVDFGSNPIDVTGLRIWGDMTSFTNGPDAFHLEYSEDGRNWSVVSGSTRSGIDTNSVYEYSF
jgi:hypothetical protein